MTRPRRRSEAPPWPPALSRDTPLDRARWFAREILRVLGPADAAQVERFRQMAIGYGEMWLVTSPDPGPGEWMTREQVAIRGGVHVAAVSQWSYTGLADHTTGQPRRLTRHPEGYDPQEVAEFLRWRSTRPTPSRDRRALPCTSTRSATSSPASTASVRAATCGNVSRQTA